MKSQRPQYKSSLLFGSLYFEGAPMGLVWWAFPALMASGGLGVQQVSTMAALSTVPWTFKFLLGPFADRYLTHPQKCARCIAWLQAMMLLPLGLLVSMPLSQFQRIVVLCVALSTLSAIQDVAIDSWALRRVQPSERGQMNGAMQVGLLAGRWLFGSGLLIASQFISWQLSLVVLLVLLLGNVLVMSFGAWGDVPFKPNPNPQKTGLD